VNCANCGVPLTVGKRFCGDCGSPVVNATTGSPQRSSQGTGERRQVTVVFCDLVGSTALSNVLDPEVMRDLIREYQDVCVGVISRAGGYVAQYLGDGILAYFGYPVADENSVANAVQSSLVAVQRVGLLRAPQGIPLQMRAGIDSGLVVIGDAHATTEVDRLAIGDAPNIAARLQAIIDLGEHALKGISIPVRVWIASGETGHSNRFEAATAGRATPMVGRDQPLQTVVDSWHRIVASGGVQTVLVSGEAGIGKSRFISALRQALALLPNQVWMQQCAPQYANSALYPVVRQLERAAALTREQTEPERLSRLQSLLGERYRRPPQEVSLLAQLLGIPCPPEPSLQGLTPQKLRELTLHAIADLAASASQVQPLLLIFEDVHWTDASTLELLSLLQQAPTTEQNFLLLISHRPEFTPPWARPQLATIELSRLQTDEVCAVISTVTDAKSLPAQVVAAIVQHTDGVPLFVEELTRTVLESGLLRETEDGYELSVPDMPVVVPNTLRDSLMARLDRLSPVKEVAQIGACIGREFTFELLVEASTLEPTELRHALAQLENAQLIFARDQQHYVFKHALVRDAAYDSLLKSQRLLIHAKLAEVIETQFPALAQAEPETLAYHYVQAGQPGKAAPQLIAAGTNAMNRMAIQEAIAHLQHALDAIASLPQSVQRDAMELQARSLLGGAWTTLGGWFHPKVPEVLIPARPIAQRLEHAESLTIIGWGLGNHLLTTGRMTESVAAFRALELEIAPYGQPAMSLIAKTGLVSAGFWNGQITETLHRAREVKSAYVAERDQAWMRYTGHDPYALSTLYESLALWIAGYPDSALRMNLETERLARAHHSPFDIGFALSPGLFSLWFNGEQELLRSRIEVGIAYGEQSGLVLFSQFYPPLLRGMLAVNCDQCDVSIALIEGYLTASNSIGSGIPNATCHGIIAESFARLAKPGLARDHIDRALARVASSGERFIEAELLRINGTVCELEGRMDDAELAYRDSIACALKQGARSWELRASTYYADLLTRRGDRRKARNLLEPIYGWFTEGRSSRDHKKAEALLQRLRPYELASGSDGSVH
jgi:class 3 adenylate cyclase